MAGLPDGEARPFIQRQFPLDMGSIARFRVGALDLRPAFR